MPSTPKFWTLTSKAHIRQVATAYEHSMFSLAQPTKDCCKCKKSAIPERGVALSSTRWMCAKCWTLRSRTKAKQRNDEASP